MPITSITSEPASLSLTVVGDYAVPVQRLWAAWTDPRQLERFWGPQEWPATFTQHDLRVGGRAEYHMTGPNGEIARGWWVFDEVDPPRAFTVRDGFATDDGTPNLDLPVSRMRMQFSSTPTGSRFLAVSTYASLEAMEQVLAMGMLEGLQSALAQLDDTLADLREHAAQGTTTLEIIDATHVRITREVRGRIDAVWRAFHEPALLRRWMLGPDGWTMPVCEVAREPGASFRYEWTTESGEDRFGFVGELVEAEPPRRAVTTERMIGVDGPGTVNELRLDPLPGDRTRITTIITYPSQELRDLVLATGMVDGMQASYTRLESVLDR